MPATCARPHDVLPETVGSRKPHHDAPTVLAYSTGQRLMALAPEESPGSSRLPTSSGSTGWVGASRSTGVSRPDREGARPGVLASSGVTAAKIWRLGGARAAESDSLANASRVPRWPAAGQRNWDAGSPEGRVRLNGDHLDQTRETPQVVRIAGVHREADSAGRGGYEQVHSSRAAGLAPFCDHRGVDPPVRPGGLAVEGQGVKRRLGALEPVLPAGSLFAVIGDVRAGRQLGHGDRTDGDLDGSFAASTFSRGR